MVTKYFTSFAAILARIGRGPLGTYATEFVCVFIIWVMFLVGAAVFTVRLTSPFIFIFCRIGPHVIVAHIPQLKMVPRQPKGLRRSRDHQSILVDVLGVDVFPAHR